MVIEKIDIEGVAFLKTKYDPPITADRDAPEAFQVAAETMQAEAWNVQVVDLSCGVQAGEHKNYLAPQIGAQFASVVVFEQPPQSAMPNVSDHAAVVV